MCDQVFSKCLVGEQKEWGELGPSTTSIECLQSLQEAFALSYLEPTDSNSIVCPLQFHHCTFINTGLFTKHCLKYKYLWQEHPQRCVPQLTLML